MHAGFVDRRGNIVGEEAFLPRAALESVKNSPDLRKINVSEATEVGLWKRALRKIFRKHKARSIIEDVSIKTDNTITSNRSLAKDQFESPGKRCAICGAICSDDSIQCDKCGGGIFSSHKSHSESREAIEADKTKEKRQTSTIPFAEYRKFAYDLGRSLRTTNPDVIYAAHVACCKKCRLQLTPEALDKLLSQGPGSLGSGGLRVVIGATKEGNNLRAGRCPRCGNAEMEISVKKKHKRIQNIESLMNTPKTK